VVSEYGDAMRSDVGSLGAGIYFAEKIDVSLGYCKREVNGGKDTFLVCLCGVALGACKEYSEVETGLTEAPEGYQSCWGVAGTNGFAENEFVVYETRQYRIKYVIELKSTEEEEEEELVGEGDWEEEDSGIEMVGDDNDGDLKVVESGEETSSGLKSGSGEDLPLRSVHVRAKLIDMIGQVTMYQEYENTGGSAIEARYVFPLVGVCKEKQQARREYREAIEQGKGAYLMDQETVEVFTVNIGNLPPNSRLVYYIFLIFQAV